MRAVQRLAPVLVALLSWSAAGSAQAVPRGGSAGEESPADATIRGSVAGTFQGGRRPLGYATVQASMDDRRWATAADSAGRYALEGLPAGDLTIRASYPGHAPIELVVVVPPGATVEVDLDLLAEPISLSPLRVRRDRAELDVPDAADRDVSNSGALSEVELQALDVSPGIAQDGLIDAVRSLPGNDPADPTDVLFMRGSTTDLKLVLLDGVPVYTPFHVGGLLRSFEPAVLGTADLHVGGAPARYDGGLTHILDLRTRTARRDRVRASGSLDLLTASAALEAPLGSRAGVIASTRTLHDLGETPLQGERPYGYRDLLVAVDAEPKAGHEIGATGFWNSEAVLLDYPGTSDDATWGNLAGSASYARTFEGGRVQVSAGASAYTASLPLKPTSTSEDPAPTALLASAGTERVRLVAEGAWGPADAPWRAGISYERIEAAFKAEPMAGGALTSESRGRAETTGAFVESIRPLAAGLTIRTGLRIDHFAGTGARLAPRAALMWDVGPDALLSVAAGRYHQPTRTPDPQVEHTLSEVARTGVEAEDLLPVATADHVVLSLNQRLGGTVDLGLEGFWKRYEGLRADPEETILSSGLDVRVLSAGERVSGWLGYGLSWYWSGVDLSGHATDFAGRHLLTMGLAGGLGGPLRGEARLAYGAGLPYTSIPFRPVADHAAQPTVASAGAPRSGFTPRQEREPVVEGLDETFLRIDLEVHALFEPEWGGHRWAVRPYLRILNALDRRDAMFYSLQPWRGEQLTPLAERAFLPLLGVTFSF